MGCLNGKTNNDATNVRTTKKRNPPQQTTGSNNDNQPRNMSRAQIELENRQPEPAMTDPTLRVSRRESFRSRVHEMMSEASENQNEDNIAESSRERGNAIQPPRAAEEGQQERIMLSRDQFRLFLLNNIIESASNGNSDTNLLAMINLLSLINNEEQAHFSEEEINRIPTRIYRPSSEKENCAICQEQILMGDIFTNLKPCHHQYHFDCIKHWLEKSVVCPMCRVRIQID